MVIIKRISISVLLILMVLGSIPYGPGDNVVDVVIAHEGSPDPGMGEIELSARGTYLHDDPYLGGVGATESPLIVDLQSEGFLEGDNILISYTGQVFSSAGWDDRPIVYEEPDDLIGVFSTSTELLSVSEYHRVPGAIDSGIDIDTGETWFNHEPTDIPEDFEINPPTGFWIEVPRNARYLFICQEDSYYSDNVGSIQVTLEKDTDGDGLLDSWEQFGIDYDNDGTIDLDLPMMGADFEHKDVFVEADYMAGRRPKQDAINDVEAAFANANVGNPDGIFGINLHVTIDEAVPAVELLNSFDEYYQIKDTYFGTADERTDQNTINAKKLVFRYCLFVVKIWFDPPNYNCSGVAEGIPSDDFMVALGAFPNSGSRDEQAGTFMHELGHTLGLRHGGDVNVNYKPNYLSVMNYAFQLPYWNPNRPLDFSEGYYMDLDEANLDENMGISLNEVTVWTGPNGTIYSNNGNDLYIDWNCSGTIDAFVQVNLNNHSDAPSPPDEVLTDYDDWSNIVYRFRGTRLAQRGATVEDYHQELTYEEIQAMYKQGEQELGLTYTDDDKEDSDFPIVIVIIIAIAVFVAMFILAGVLILILKGKSRSGNEK